jgi:FMN-dependent NADH-azoreductase
MKKILHIISSPRGDASNSIKLGNGIIEKIRDAYPLSTVKETNLVTNRFPHLQEEQLASFFTPPDKRTAANLSALQHSNEAIADLMEADIIVIGAPMYNFGIHSSLKAWIDHLVRSGVTFNYDENGAEGLVKGKKIYLAISSGFVYTEGPLKSMDFIEPYLRTALGFMGMTDITVVRAEGVSVPGLQETALEKAIVGFSLA